MKTYSVVSVATIMATAMLAAGAPATGAAAVLSLTYTTPECSTVVRRGRTYAIYATTILWANDGSRTAADYVSRNGMACQAGIIMCTPTECSLPLTSCYQYLRHWVRVGLVGRAPTQLNLAYPGCPVN